mmetsp:Transcript_28913/g.49276  ORF Transcript_28913/g.49276 Transcript_28913/m.49276 type:complete len:252 (-) Transcript_28913:4091-4846(-)
MTHNTPSVSGRLEGRPAAVEREVNSRDGGLKGPVLGLHPSVPLWALGVVRHFLQRDPDLVPDVLRLARHKLPRGHIGDVAHPLGVRVRKLAVGRLVGAQELPVLAKEVRVLSGVGQSRGRVPLRRLVAEVLQVRLLVVHVDQLNGGEVPLAHEAAVGHLVAGPEGHGEQLLEGGVHEVPPAVGDVLHARGAVLEGVLHQRGAGGVGNEGALAPHHRRVAGQAQPAVCQEVVVDVVDARVREDVVPNGVCED